MSSGYGLNGGTSTDPPNSTPEPIPHPSLTTPLPSPSRAIPLLPLLARTPRLLRRQHQHRRRLGQEEMSARDGRLLRMSTPQERGLSVCPHTPHLSSPPRQAPFFFHPLHGDSVDNAFVEPVFAQIADAVRCVWGATGCEDKGAAGCVSEGGG